MSNETRLQPVNLDLVVGEFSNHKGHRLHADTDLQNTTESRPWVFPIRRDRAIAVQVLRGRRAENSRAASLVPVECAVRRGTVEATEEAIINAMVVAETMVGINGNKVYALPHDRLQAILKNTIG